MHPSAAVCVLLFGRHIWHKLHVSIVELLCCKTNIKPMQHYGSHNSIHDSSCKHLIASGSFWGHLVASGGSIWERLAASWSIVYHFAASRSIWAHLAASRSIFAHLGASGSSCVHLGASGSIWDHLRASGASESVLVSCHMGAFGSI